MVASLAAFLMDSTLTAPHHIGRLTCISKKYEVRAYRYKSAGINKIDALLLLVVHEDTEYVHLAPAIERRVYENGKLFMSPH